ncbi:MAG: hypothetical protein JXQ90_06000 [Cyclobacteriaceae bacterium]
MIENISNYDRDQEYQINGYVGPSYNFWESLKMGGTGSQKFVINSAHEIFEPFLKHIRGTRYCNIELRPKGIGLRFRFRLEAIGWFVPYKQLEFQHDQKQLSLRDKTSGFTMDLIPAHRSPVKTQFINKMRAFAGLA